MCLVSSESAPVSFHPGWYTLFQPMYFYTKLLENFFYSDILQLLHDALSDGCLKSYYRSSVPSRRVLPRQDGRTLEELVPVWLSV